MLTYFAHRFLSWDFFGTLGTPVYSETPEAYTIHFFPWLQVVKQEFTSLFIKNLTSCIGFLQSGTWNLSNYFEISLKFSPAFQNTEAASKRCSTKVVVQQNDMMKYSSSGPVVKSRKSVTCKFPKNCTPSQIFFNEFDHKFKAAILKCVLIMRLDGCFWEQLIFENVLRQLQRYTHFKSSNAYTYLTYLTKKSR